MAYDQNGVIPRCPICEGGRRTFAVAASPGLDICEDCRHITWRASPTNVELADYYHAKYSAFRKQVDLQTGNREYYRSHLSYLAPQVRDVERLTLVDFGCAWPTLLEEATKLPEYGTVYGIDYDAAARLHGEKMGIKMLLPTDVDRAIPDGSVHIVRFSHVLEHLIEPGRVLSQMVRKVAAGGIIYITQPQFPSFQLDTPPGSILDALYPEHLHFFSMQSVARLVDQSGLKLLEIAAHGSADTLEEKYQGLIDREYVMERTPHLSGLTPDYFDKRGRFPDFIGDNLHLLARKL